MTYASIDDLRSQLGKTPSAADDPVYAAKQLHRVPDAEVVDRARFILQRVAGKRVLEFGASGQMHDAIVKAAASVVGVDKHDRDGVIGFDLDDVAQIAVPPFRHDVWLVGSDVTASHFYHPETPSDEFDLIVCGEVLEHLGNPGWFLTRLRRQYVGIPVIITVPNAHSASGVKQLTKGIENVNKEHVAWYSWRTLKTLIERAGFTVKEFAWYNGAPYFAEGLIMVVV